MKSVIAVSAATFLTLAFSSDAAITVVGNNLGASGRILADATGTPLPTGNLIRVGFFNDPVADTAIISGTDFGAIDNLFQSLGEGETNSGTVSGGALGIGATPGRFSFTVSDIQQSYLPPNKLMFFWVFNAPSTASATQWAIFTNDDNNDGNDPWLSKLEDPGVPTSGDISLAVQQTRVDDASDVFTGSIVDNQLRLEVIPEPSLAALAMSAAAALTFRRRRS